VKTVKVRAGKQNPLRMSVFTGAIDWITFRSNLGVGSMYSQATVNHIL